MTGEGGTATDEGEGLRMREKLCYVMSVLLAIAICVPAGTVQAVAEGVSQAGEPAASSPAVETTESGDAPQASSASSSSGQDDAVPTTTDVEAMANGDVQAEDAEGESGQSAPEPARMLPLRAPATSAFHATISSNMESYSAGSTAVFSVRYTIDRGAFKEGDTVSVGVPKEVASKVRFSVDPLHFSSATDNGDGTWKLTFGPNASVALAGSFSMYITTAEVTTQTTAPVTVGGASKDLIVIPKGSAAGVGTYTDAIMKDANDGDVSYGGYDYSEGVGDDAAQIGVYDSTKDANIGYRLFVNNKRATMDHITVVDTLPDGMTFDRTKDILVTDSSGKTVDPSLYTMSISGQELTFSYPGTLGDSLTISYWVDAQGGTNIKYTNRAEIYYQSGGTAYQEHRNYVLQGNNYNAACGEKSVDKTVVTPDPADQMVTYTIKFWNSNGFATDEINLDDHLDSNVRFLYADEGDKFDVSYDDASHSIHIQNTAGITGNETEYVSFVTDFTDVPEGYTVTNTVGGNTTKTLKMPAAQLSATKTVDGAAPKDGQTFTFQLCDEQGNVLQEKTNDGQTVAFDKIAYSEDDLSADGGDASKHYTVREKTASDPSYTYDDTVYDVSVNLHKGVDSAGRAVITATPAYSKDGTVVSSMTFDNKSNTVSVSGSKVWDDDGNRDGIRPDSITVNLLKDGVKSESKVISASDDWSYGFGGLAKYDASDAHEYVYTISEEPVEGYSVRVVGDAASGFTITNTHEPAKLSVTVTKIWNDGDNKDGSRPSSIKVQLLADGAPVDEPVELDAVDGSTHTWTGMFEKENGRDIVYGVQELDVPSGYKASVTGDAAAGFTVTNTKTASPADSGNSTEESGGDSGLSGLPQTGDGSWGLAVAALLAGGAALAIVMAALRRRGF